MSLTSGEAFMPSRHVSVVSLRFMLLDLKSSQEQWSKFYPRMTEFISYIGKVYLKSSCKQAWLLASNRYRLMSLTTQERRHKHEENNEKTMKTMKRTAVRKPMWSHSSDNRGCIMCLI